MGERRGGAGSWACTRTLEDHASFVFAVVFSPNNAVLATAGYDTKIYVYSVANDFFRMFTLQGPTGIIWSLFFSPDHTRLVSCSRLLQSR